MSDEISVLRERAEAAKKLYAIGKMSQSEAIEEVKPYIEAVNAKSKEIAKKYHQKPRFVSALKFLRQ